MPNLKRGHVKYARRIHPDWVVSMDTHLKQLKATVPQPKARKESGLEAILKKAVPDEMWREFKEQMRAGIAALTDPSNTNPIAVQFREKLKTRLTDKEIALLNRHTT